MATLSEWVESWIDRRSIRLAPSTLSGYRRIYRKYLLPSKIADIELQNVGSEDLIFLLTPLIREGHTRQAQIFQKLLNAVLKDAVKQRIIAFNPMDSVDRIKHHRKRMNWLDLDDARKLLESAKESGDPYYLAWLLALCCGLRRGELLGLRWSDIDLRNGILHIQRQRQRVDGQIYERAPKSESSIRDIPIDGALVRELLHYRQISPYVISGDGQNPATDKQLEHALDKAIARANVPRVTLHGLRHTMAATAATEGISIKLLQMIMGHAQYSTTADIYAHVDSRAIRAAVSTISTAIIG